MLDDVLLGCQSGSAFKGVSQPAGTSLLDVLLMSCTVVVCVEQCSLELWCVRINILETFRLEQPSAGGKSAAVETTMRYSKTIAAQEHSLPELQYAQSQTTGVQRQTTLGADQRSVIAARARPLAAAGLSWALVSALQTSASSQPQSARLPLKRSAACLQTASARRA